MKTLGRIFIILAVTALITAALYFVVNASGMGTRSDFRPHGEQFQPTGQFQPGGTRPTFEGGRSERGGEGRGGGGGWIFGLVKNVGVVALLVAILILPKGLAKRKRLAAVKTNSEDLS